MSIGEDLAAARRQAGLTVTQVSQQTRIRETLIRAIERGEFAACGGDFYARGHIRAIAGAVGADPAPLVAAYDAAHRPRPVTAADLFRPVTPVHIRERRRLNWAVVLALALVAALGVVAYHVITGSRHPPGPSAGAAAALHRASHRHPHHAPAPATSTPAPNPYAHIIAIHLTAIEDCWVEFTTPAGGYLSQSIVAGGTSKQWTFRHPVDMRLGNPGDVRLSVDGTNPLPPGTADPITLSLGLDGKISS